MNDSSNAISDNNNLVNDNPNVNEENFRLINSFNDIFVVTASLLLIISAGWLTYRIHPGIGGATAAALAWLLSEFFVRKRRMALPAIVLMNTFLIAIYWGIQASVINLIQDKITNGNDFTGFYLAIAPFVTGLFAWVYWQRFKVPMTIATIVSMATACIFTILPNDLVQPFLLIAGVAMLALALWFDAQDTKRSTQKADIAFWLHLYAAPIIVYGLFGIGGSLYGEIGIVKATLIVGLYALFALISLVIDRRALLVSALTYVLFSIAAIFKTLGANDVAFAVSAAVIGSSLLLLSAYWQPCRAFVMRLVPIKYQRYLPTF
jgi:hypothetical protein